MTLLAAMWRICLKNPCRFSSTAASLTAPTWAFTDLSQAADTAVCLTDRFISYMDGPEHHKWPAKQGFRNWGGQRRRGWWGHDERVADDHAPGDRVTREWPFEGHFVVGGSGLYTRTDCFRQHIHVTHRELRPHHRSTASRYDTGSNRARDSTACGYGAWRPTAGFDAACIGLRPNKRERPRRRTTRQSCLGRGA